MTTQIKETMKYDMFELMQFNRDTAKTEKLEQSMFKHGWIDAYPMHVILDKRTGLFLIKAGHHRFMAARKISIPVKYVVCCDISDIHELEGATTGWSINDYLVSYVKTGRYDYDFLKKYHEKSNFPLGFCISICAGQTGGSMGGHIRRFKSGDYKIGDQKQAERVFKYTQHLKNAGFGDYCHDRFIKAFAKCFRVEQFDPDSFVKKAKSNISTMVRQSSVENWLQVIEKIYNHGSKSKIPLSFLATEEVKKRSISYNHK